MNAVQKQYGPFAFVPPAGWGRDHLITLDVQSRVSIVKQSTDADWLQAVIEHHDMQKTVQRAARRRLKWVNKAVAGLMAQVNAEAHRSAPEADGERK